MATATNLEPVTISEIKREDWDGVEVESGQHVQFGALGFARPVFDSIADDEHPSFGAWDELLDEVFEEVHPKIADLFYEAINRRLPWTWEEK